MWKSLRRPSPAMVVALIALFVALGGTATAVTVAIVPLAERAYVADNALKLRGKTASQAVKGLLSVKTRRVTGRGDQGFEDVSCDPGQRVIAGGYHYGWNDNYIEEWGRLIHRVRAYAPYDAGCDIDECPRCGSAGSTTV